MFYTVRPNMFLGYVLPPILVALLVFPVIQYFTCLVAYRLGDDSPEMKARLTLDPRAHIDPVGLLCLALFRFGWPKPLPINPANFYKVKDRKTGVLLVALAGPAGALVAAFVFLFIRALLLTFFSLSAFSIISMLLFYTAAASANIAVIFCLPLPGMPGREIFYYLFPKTAQKAREFFTGLLPGRYSAGGASFALIFFLVFLCCPLILYTITRVPSFTSTYVLGFFDRIIGFILTPFLAFA